MITFYGGLYEPCHIRIPKIDVIDKVNFPKYNCKSLNFMSNKNCVVNFRFFYFNDDGKPDIFICKNKYCLWKTRLLFFSSNALS